MNSQFIENVLTTLEVINITISVKENQKNLQELLKNIPGAIDEISLFKNKPEFRSYSNKIKLCGTLVAATLPSFVKLLSAGTDPALKEITHYLVEKLHWCFNEISRIIHGGGLDDDSEPSGLFIRSVENLTNFFLNVKENDVPLKILIDDLLCHALTIAKTADLEDYHEISASCKNILSNVSDVFTQEDLDKIPLKKEDILCSVSILERKVNIAVLRLYLNVSSKFLPPLKNIVKKAGSSYRDRTKTRETTDIQFEINSLDVYYERVQLIGNYAVACTDCKKKKLQVQCCLASLEFLANFIIPAAMSFYVDPTNLVKKRFLQFLTDECLDELKTFTGYLDYNIVDTTAFVEVFYEDVTDIIFSLKEKFCSGKYSQIDSEELISKCYKLVNHLNATDDVLVKGNQNINSAMKQLLSGVKAHRDICRDPKAFFDKNLFCSKLDFIIHKIRDILLYLNDNLGSTQNSSQNSTKLSCQYSSKNWNNGKSITIFTNIPKHDLSEKSPLKSQAGVSSKPFVVCTKKNGKRCTTYKLYRPPSTPNNNTGSLDPFLSKIKETPLLRSTVHVQTPYNETYLKRNLPPKNLSFNDMSGNEVNLSLN